MIDDVRRLALLLGTLLAIALPGASAGCHGLFVRPGLVGEACVESERFALRTDVAADARATLLAEADAMARELDVLFPAPRGGGAGERRRIIAFAREDDFRKFLRAHLFSQDRAIGFYCDQGSECALVWRDPPGPEDVRVLRHELVHQHLAERLPGRVPAWLEEGLAERIALGVEPDGPFGSTLADAAAGGGAPGQARGRGARDGAGGGAGSDGPEGAPERAIASGAGPIHGARLLVSRGGPGGAAALAGGSSWSLYRMRRFRADAIFAALEVHAGRASWPDARGESAAAIPAPAWSSGERGYVLHLLFVRFLESIGEGRRGALGRMLARCAAGEDADLDLSHRYRSVGAVEAAFHAYVLDQGLAALMDEGGGAGAIDPASALDRLDALREATAADPPAAPGARPPPTR